MCGSKILALFLAGGCRDCRNGSVRLQLSRFDAIEAGRARCIGCEFQNFVRAFVERLVASSMESFEVRV